MWLYFAVICNTKTKYLARHTTPRTIYSGCWLVWCSHGRVFNSKWIPAWTYNVVSCDSLMVTSFTLSVTLPSLPLALRRDWRKVMATTLTLSYPWAVKGGRNVGGWGVTDPPSKGRCILRYRTVQYITLWWNRSAQEVLPREQRDKEVFKGERIRGRRVKKKKNRNKGQGKGVLVWNWNWNWNINASAWPTLYDGRTIITTYSHILNVFPNAVCRRSDNCGGSDDQGN